LIDLQKKTLKYQIWWKSVQWEPSCSLWTDRQTDRHDGAKYSLFAVLRTRR